MSVTAQLSVRARHQQRVPFLTGLASLAWAEGGSPEVKLHKLAAH